MLELEFLLKSMATGKVNWASPEHFARCAFTLAARDYGFPEECEVQGVVDGLGDRGLDGIALAIGDTAILEADDVEDAITAARAGEPLRALFVQAKNQERIPEAEVKKFADSVQEFLTYPRDRFERLKPNPATLAFWNAYDQLRAAAPDLAKAAHVSLVFAYRGDWKDFTLINIARDDKEEAIKYKLPDLRYDYLIWDAAELVGAGNRVGPVNRRPLKNVALLAMSETAAPGYVGHVGARALVDLVSRPAGKKRIALDFMFADNVRAFLGTDNPRDNPGAAGLKAALAAGRQAQVLLCHNGVTIVAAEAALRKDGGTIDLISPQIVNGCQSAHIFVALADSLGDARIPLKIVVTEDPELIDEIVLASNTQATVDAYDLLARNKGLRGLESVFTRAEVPLVERIWLQRRRNQAVDFPDTWKTQDWSRVMQPRHLLDAFAASIGASPSTVHREPVRVLALAKDGVIFNERHEPTLYRALGWMVCNGRRWARRHGHSWRDRYVFGGTNAYPARHHFIHALWRLADLRPDDIEPAALLKSGAADTRFQALIKALLGHGDALSDAAGAAVKAAADALKRPLSSDLAGTDRMQQEVRAAADGRRGAVRKALGLPTP
jgi:hypothetical protein